MKKLSLLAAFLVLKMILVNADDESHVLTACLSVLEFDPNFLCYLETNLTAVANSGNPIDACRFLGNAYFAMVATATPRFDGTLADFNGNKLIEIKGEPVDGKGYKLTVKIFGGITFSTTYTRDYFKYELCIGCKPCMTAQSPTVSVLCDFPANVPGNLLGAITGLTARGGK